ncbi:MAG: flagellar basal body rod protein [Peptoclostridium sp.]|uniref:flagellar hook-basal body protein n=1 Tax=Peptoclostridium sp. TaxID=1904860 RepID=UPI00139D824C|nr:flagellar basal body rod C-terminal domain-containing protein [Peptoclostridium sp.]MZQ74591.1 flagellar basal body rod protein [Peptoclostridium sp.]
MYRGIYTVTSSMMTNQKKLDVTSNNMANASTAGFKKDELITKAFPEKLLSKINGLSYSQNQKDKTVDVSQDGNGAWVVSSRQSFFTVDGSDGKSYSRDMKLARDTEGYLRTYTRNMDSGVDTSKGYYVLDSNGKRVQAGAGFSIDAQGNVVSGGATVANLLYTPPRSVIGTINGGMSVDYIKSNFLQGNLEQTNDKLDFAIKGSGFFEVQSQDGAKRYIRDGAFKISSECELITNEGMKVMGENGPIRVQGELEAKPDGSLYVGGEMIGKLRIVNVNNQDSLRKVGNNTYEIEPKNDPQLAPFDGELVQGFIEGSNVNPVSEMIEMIEVMRNYENAQKVIKTYDDIMAKASTELGKL